MEIKRLRKKGLTRFFINHIIQFSIVIFVWGILVFGIFLAMLESGAILPANFVQNQLSEMQKREVTREEIDEILPYVKEYAFFSNEEIYINGSVDDSTAYGWQSAYTGADDLYRMHVLTWQDGICIITYQIKAKFANPAWNRYLAEPEVIGILLLIFGFIADIIWISWLLKKKLMSEFDNMKEITSKIERKELDFTIGDSKIIEINGLLDSIHSMRAALLKALEEQWSQEQLLKEQVASLAHDVKTPLTIIRGNLELLKETEEDVMNQELLNYMDEGTTQLEDYIDILVEINSSGKGYECNMALCSIWELAQEIEQEKNSLMSARRIKISFENQAEMSSVMCDKILLMRAIGNILANAADFARQSVRIQLENDRDWLCLHIVDDGPGFSREALEKSKNQLYMEDSSRHGSQHFGMGLYIADTILKQHNGTVFIKNDEKTGGGYVEIRIPCIRSGV